MTKRYDHDTRSDCYGMREATNGDYVRYEDYARLLSALKALLRDNYAHNVAFAERVIAEAEDAS